MIANLICIMTTTRCTLNCKLCIAGVPLFKEKGYVKDASVQEINASFDALFNIYDYVEHVDFSGGEPLLWGQDKIIDCIKHLELFIGKIGIIRITTNGTLLPSPALIDLIKATPLNVAFILDNYGDLSSRICEVKALLDLNGVAYREKIYFGDEQHCEGWVDALGDFLEKNYSESEGKQVYERCLQAHFAFLTIWDGKLYPCGPTLTLELCKGITDASCVLPLTDTEVTLAEKVAIAKQFGSIAPIACAYCNGFDPENAVRFPAGEQA